MAIKMTFEERQVKHEERRILHLCQTAAGILRDFEISNGLDSKSAGQDYHYFLTAIRPYVLQAMSEVASLHVPRRAAKLYKDAKW